MFYDVFVDYYDSSSTLVFLFSELTNFIFCSIFLLILFYFKKLNYTELFVWLFGFLSIIFIVFVFDMQSLFPDSGGYLRCVRDIRDNFSFDEFGCQSTFQGFSTESETLSLPSHKRGLTGILYAIVPIPFITTLASLGVVNKIYLFGLYMFLRERLNNNQSKIILLFSFFLPTVLIYSSNGLRDNLIMVNQVLLLFAIIEKRFLFSTFLLAILFAIKTQNALILSLLYFGVFIFRSHKSFAHLFVYSMVVFAVLIINQELIVSTLNYFRLAFINEEGGWGVPMTISADSVAYGSLGSLVLSSPLTFIKAMFAPGLSLDIFNMIFFFESLVLIYILVKLVFLNNYFASSLNVLVFFVFVVGVCFNQLIVENVNTLLRYRYTFMYLFLFYVLFVYDSGSKKINFPFLPRTKWSKVKGVSNI